MVDSANVIWEEKRHRALQIFEEVYGRLSPREIAAFHTAFELGVMAGASNPDPVFEEEHQDDVRALLYRHSDLSRDAVKLLTPEQLWWVDTLGDPHKPFTGSEMHDPKRISTIYERVRALWQHWRTKAAQNKAEATV